MSETADNNLKFGPTWMRELASSDRIEGANNSMAPNMQFNRNRPIMAPHRYSREKMLALCVAADVPPETIANDPADICGEVDATMPLAFTAMSFEEQRVANRSTNADPNMRILAPNNNIRGGGSGGINGAAMNSGGGTMPGGALGGPIGNNNNNNSNSTGLPSRGRGMERGGGMRTHRGSSGRGNGSVNGYPNYPGGAGPYYAAPREEEGGEGERVPPPGMARRGGVEKSLTSTVPWPGYYTGESFTQGHEDRGGASSPRKESRASADNWRSRGEEAVEPWRRGDRTRQPGAWRGEEPYYGGAYGRGRGTRGGAARSFPQFSQRRDLPEWADEISQEPGAAGAYESIGGYHQQPQPAWADDIEGGGADFLSMARSRPANPPPQHRPSDTSMPPPPQQHPSANMVGSHHQQAASGPSATNHPPPPAPTSAPPPSYLPPHSGPPPTSTPHSGAPTSATQPKDNPPTDTQNSDQMQPLDDFSNHNGLTSVNGYEPTTSMMSNVPSPGIHNTTANTNGRLNNNIPTSNTGQSTAYHNIRSVNNRPHDSAFERAMQSNADDLVSKLVDDDGKRHNGSNDPNALLGGQQAGVVNPPAGFMPLSEPVLEQSDHWYYTDPQQKVQGPFSAENMTQWCRLGYFSETLLVRKDGEEHWNQLGELTKKHNRVPFLPEPPVVKLETKAELIEKERRFQLEIHNYELHQDKYLFAKAEYDKAVVHRSQLLFPEMQKTEGFAELPEQQQRQYFMNKIHNYGGDVICDPTPPPKPLDACLYFQEQILARVPSSNAGLLIKAHHQQHQQQQSVSELPASNVAGVIPSVANTNNMAPINTTNNSVVSQMLQQQLEKELLQQQQQQPSMAGIDVLSQLNLNLNPTAIANNAALLELQQKQLQQMVGNGAHMQQQQLDVAVQPKAADPIRDLVQQMSVGQKNGQGLSTSMSCSNLQPQQHLLQQQHPLQQQQQSLLAMQQQQQGNNMFLSHSKSMASLPGLYDQQMQQQLQQQSQLQQQAGVPSELKQQLAQNNQLQDWLKHLPLSNNTAAVPALQQQQQRPASVESHTSSSIYSNQSSSNDSNKQATKVDISKDTSVSPPVDATTGLRDDPYVAKLLQDLDKMRMQKEHQQSTIEAQAQMIEEQRLAHQAKEEQEARKIEEIARVKREREHALQRKRDAEEEQIRVRAELKIKQEEDEKRKVAAAEMKRKKEEEKLKNKPKSMEEANKRQEEKRKQAESEARRKEEKRLNQEVMKAAKAQKKAEAAAAAKAAWGGVAPTPSMGQGGPTPSMSEIQRRQQEQGKQEREAKGQEDSRKAAEMMPVSAPSWGAPKGAAVKSITQIQAEESRRKKQQQKEAETVPKATPVVAARPAPAASWAAKIGPPAGKGWTDAPVQQPAVGGFWDAPPRSLAASTSVARLPTAPAAPKLPRAASAATLPAPKAVKNMPKKVPEVDAATQLKRWAQGAVEKLPRCNNAVDVFTLMDVLVATESPYEVHDYVRTYVGDTSAHKTFVRTFLERRSALKAVERARATGTDDITAPARAVNPTDTPMETRKNQKKGKKKTTQRAENSMHSLD